jgi:hypothetical protein
LIGYSEKASVYEPGGVSEDPKDGFASESGTCRNDKTGTKTPGFS